MESACILLWSLLPHASFGPPLARHPLDFHYPHTPVVLSTARPPSDQLVEVPPELFGIADDDDDADSELSSRPWAHKVEL